MLYQVTQKGEPITDPMPYDEAVSEKQRIVTHAMSSFLADTEGDGDTEKFLADNYWEVVPV